MGPWEEGLWKQRSAEARQGLLLLGLDFTIFEQGCWDRVSEEQVGLTPAFIVGVLEWQPGPGG